MRYNRTSHYQREAHVSRPGMRPPVEAPPARLGRLRQTERNHVARKKNQNGYGEDAIKEQLLAQALATMNAVPTNFVSLMANMIRPLLYALKAIEEKKAA